MKILFAASEAVPFIKSGGLADVAGSLTKAVRNRQHAMRVVLPLYDDISPELLKPMKFVTSFYVPLGWRNQYCGVYELNHQGVIYYFLDNEYYFKRNGIYGFFDDAERFAFFSKAILEMLLNIDFDPDVIHCNDWQTALVPVFLNEYYRGTDKLNKVSTLFTIHNIQYQGTYDIKVATEVLGLSPEGAKVVEYNKDTNFMKGAIETCDAISTVSPSYANEILDPWYAHGLDSILREKKYKLSGILNGIDYTVYDPETDSRIPRNYTAADFKNKLHNKKMLQRTLGLSESADTMVIGMVSRLVSHKGLDLVCQVFGQMMELNVQFILLGSGDWQYEKYFRETVARYPNRVSVTLGFDEPLSHRIYSGVDCFLMPSKSEPCGLAQMISLRYGTIPIVRSTGGLRDSVQDFGGENGNGYNFQSYSSHDMLDAIYRAFADYQEKKTWKDHITTAMHCDFSWGKSANQYIALYKSLSEQPT